MLSHLEDETVFSGLLAFKDDLQRGKNRGQGLLKLDVHHGTDNLGDGTDLSLDVNVLLLGGASLLSLV